MNLYYFCDISLFQAHQIHQVHLIDMYNQKVEYERRCYQYLLSLLYALSRFHWLVPLERKTTHSVKVELKKIYDVRGISDLLQSDNGKKFESSVRQYCQKNKIRMIKSRPYHCVKSVQIRSIFWSVFSRIWTEYREILRISPYSVRMQENTDQKILRIRTLFTRCTIRKLKARLKGFIGNLE